MARPISPELVLTGYLRGAFPMCEPETGRIEWFTCDPRAVVPLDGRFRVSRSLERVVRSGRFEIRTDTAFAKVIACCARDRSDENRNWIGPDIIRTYCELHEMGFAHSVEAWRDGQLVGGLYGVALKGAFFGESMFSVPGPGTDASKVCLVYLVNRLRRGGLQLMLPHPLDTPPCSSPTTLGTASPIAAKHSVGATGASGEGGSSGV